jgi:hypothetical protein
VVATAAGSTAAGATAVGPGGVALLVTIDNATADADGQSGRESRNLQRRGASDRT